MLLFSFEERRMRILAMLGLAAIAAAPAPERPDATAVKPVCQTVSVQRTELGKAQPGAHKLTAEPPARQILGVLRTVDGCARPVVIREDVGAPRR
jgi:hypothetical protein